MQNLTIGKKIAAGFGIILLLLAFLNISTETGISNIVSNAKQVIHGNMLDRNLAQKEIDHLNWVAKVNALLTDDQITELNVQTDDHKCGFGLWLYGEGRKEVEAMIPALGSLIKEIEEPHRRLHESAIKIKKVFQPANLQLPTKLVEIEAAHLSWASRIRDAIINQNQTLEKVQTDPGKCKLGIWLKSEEVKAAYQTGDAEFKKLWDSLPPSHNAMHHSASRIKKSLAAGDFDEAVRVFRQETSPMLAQTVKILQQLRQKTEQRVAGGRQANVIYARQAVPALHEVQAKLHKIRVLAKENIMDEKRLLNSAQTTRVIARVIGFIALLCGITLAFLTSRPIIKALKETTSQMALGASQVAEAAGEIASSSQSMADGATQQAAALEQTSSSLEEMSSMTRQNAENASQADALMKEASTVIDEADNSIEKLIISMQEISTASGETQKIVKTIDEISFQTNLLALNAAVEAARAGEAGAGFAVVADEVRNLAMRAAESAKDTSGLIESTVDKVNQGEKLLKETSETFYLASKSTGRISSLVSEIATASNEQNQGIAQVNKAVSEIDSITQQNAASAEQSSAASEQLSAQAEMMNESVQELLKMVDGKAAGQ